MVGGVTSPRNQDGTFAAGVSGNPTGARRWTPEMLQAITLARKLTPEAIKRMGELMRQKKSPAVALAAAQAIVAQVFGRPAQHVSLDDQTTPLNTAPREERVATLEDARDRINAALEQERKAALKQPTADQGVH